MFIIFKYKFIKTVIVKIQSVINILFEIYLILSAIIGKKIPGVFLMKIFTKNLIRKYWIYNNEIKFIAIKKFYILFYILHLVSRLLILKIYRLRQNTVTVSLKQTPLPIYIYKVLLKSKIFLYFRKKGKDILEEERDESWRKEISENLVNACAIQSVRTCLIVWH